MYTPYVGLAGIYITAHERIINYVKIKVFPLIMKKYFFDLFFRCYVQSCYLYGF